VSETSILVTGGAGFIGVNFVRMLLREEPDVQVVNLDALTYAGNLESLADVLDHPQHRLVHGSIADADLVHRLFQEHHFAGVINFAAESHVDRSISGPRIFLETNILGTQILLDAIRAAGTGRFLQVSTDEVYGSLGPQGAFREDSPIQPNSPYSASKASADHWVRAYHHTYGMDTVITRCSNNYGPFQFPEKMIPLCINNIRQGRPIPVYGDGQQIRDWLFVEDHCRAVWLAFRRGTAGEVYNIGGENERTNLDLVRTLLRLLEADESLITYVKDRPGHDRRYAIDATKIRSGLGWLPTVDFDEGMRRTIAWYRGHEEWLNHISAGDYQNYYQRMYAGRSA
jgi:dTDP-glucose 4,6-dehydratase